MHPLCRDWVMGGGGNNFFNYTSSPWSPLTARGCWRLILPQVSMGLFGVGGGGGGNVSCYLDDLSQT